MEFEYKGLKGKLQYLPGVQIFFGEVIIGKDIVSCCSSTKKDLLQLLFQAIDEVLNRSN